MKNQWIVEDSTETVEDLIEIDWNSTTDVEAEKSIEGVEDSIKIVDDSMEIVAESNKKVVHDLTWMDMQIVGLIWTSFLKKEKSFWEQRTSSLALSNGIKRVNCMTLGGHLVRTRVMQGLVIQE